IGRPARAHEPGGVTSEARCDLERMSVTREPDDPQQLVRGITRVTRAQLREEERSRGVARGERVRHPETGARVRPGRRRPSWRRVVVNRSRDATAGTGG